MSEAQRQARLAILYHEQRVLERKMAKGELDPAAYPTGVDGHFAIRAQPADTGEMAGDGDP